MRLVHYCAEPLQLPLKYREQTTDQIVKPTGFWVSDDDDETSWPSWCMQEHFRLGCLRHAYAVTLKPNHNVLILTTPKDLDLFTAKYEHTFHISHSAMHRMNIGWHLVRCDYQGIIITPYQWERRLDYNTWWYYGWDCASGCIWNPAAIQSIKYIKENPYAKI